MKLIYDILWLIKNIILSIVIILIFHFILEYLKENYDFDFFENYFNKPKILNVENNNLYNNNLHNNNTLNFKENINENTNKLNMDEELKNIINKGINNDQLILEKTNNLNNSDYTSIDNLPTVSQ